MKILLVYNPSAGHGRAAKILPKIEKKLQEKNIEFDIRKTDYPEHAIKIVSEVNFKDYDGIAAAGGDGTLFEVVNGYYRNTSRKRIPIGVIPVGTGNAFARDIRAPELEYIEAIDIIAAGKTKPVDVGKFTTHGQDYYFVNTLGLGFITDVTETGVKLKFLGNIAYTLGIIWQTVFLKTYKLTMELDDKTVEAEALFTEISNTRYTSNFLMAPSAENDDGFFDIAVLKKMGRLKLLKALPTVFTGEHINLKEIETWKAGKITIKTDIPKVLAMDGEILGITPVVIKCLKQGVEFFWR